MKKNNERIYLASPHMSEEGYELAYIQEAFDTNWIAPAGQIITDFENDLCHYTGAKHAAALNSAAAALHLALKLAGVKEGDQVLCQSLTYAATANAILYEKAVPIFVDSDYETWNMCPKRLEEALIKFPNVKAVMLVHIYGMAAEMDAIMALCEKYDVPLIEDAAESLGTFYKGQHTGTFGMFGAISFNGNKIITTSTGGMLLSHDKAPIERARKWSLQAKEDAPYFQHEEIGYTYRLSNVLAGIGRGQMKVLDQRVAKKQYIYEYYKKALGSLEGVSFMPMREEMECNCWLTAIQIHQPNIKPIDIFNALEKENIECRLAWKPMHLQPVFASFETVGGAVCEDLFEHGLVLPSDTKLTDKQLDRIINIIRSFWHDA